MVPCDHAVLALHGPDAPRLSDPSGRPSKATASGWAEGVLPQPRPGPSLHAKTRGSQDFASTQVYSSRACSCTYATQDDLGSGRNKQPLLVRPSEPNQLPARWHDMHTFLEGNCALHPAAARDERVKEPQGPGFPCRKTHIPIFLYTNISKTRI